MSEIYRFRTTKQLLDGFAELEKQTIHFAPPEKLNDPMEGFQDVVWSGDRIAWLNLFKDFVNCLSWGYHYVVMAGEDLQYDLPVRKVWPWNAPPSAQAEALFDAIWSRVLERAHLHQCAAKLADHGRKARKDEVTEYLRTLHASALEAVQHVYMENGLIPSTMNLDLPAGLLDPMALMNKLDLTLQIEDENMIDALFATQNSMRAETELLSHIFNEDLSDNNAYRNFIRLMLIFPSLYVEDLERLFWPDWYAACFTSSFHNSSMWGHYADQHKGICLIFQTEGTAAKPNLPLNQITGWGLDREGNSRRSRSFMPMEFHEVHYQDKPDEVDFFTSIGRLTGKDLMDLWYTDEGGSISTCAGHLLPDGDADNWRKHHWEKLISEISFKTRDWAYEQEHRLVLCHAFSDSLDQDARTLIYDFRSLTGVIFGMRTSNDDKRRIVKIIGRKCAESGRTDFQFFQAYYSPTHGDIRRHNLLIRFAVDGQGGAGINSGPD